MGAAFHGRVDSVVLVNCRDDVAVCDFAYQRAESDFFAIKSDGRVNSLIVSEIDLNMA